MRRIAKTVSLIALAFVSALAAAECRLVKTAEWSVNAGAETLVIEGAINGNAVGVALDTGARMSRIAGSAVDRLGLVRHDAGLFALTNGETVVDATSIREFRLGGSVMRDWGKLAVQGTEGRGYAVVLGQDFFQQVDVEFDLAHNVMRLFRPLDCRRGDPLAYWAPRGAGLVLLERDNERPATLVTVRLNGKPALAVVDSGAAHSVVSESLAKSLAAPIETFAIGDELIRNPDLRTADLDGRQMRLGLDFLRAHRVLVANSQRRFYFTYTGGRVFEPLRESPR